MKLIYNNMGLDLDLVPMRRAERYEGGNTFVSMTRCNCQEILEQAFGTMEDCITTGSWWDPRWTGVSLERAQPVYLCRSLPVFDAVNMVECPTGMETVPDDKPTSALRIHSGPFSVESIVTMLPFTKVYRLDPMNKLTMELLDSIKQDTEINGGLFLLKGDDGSTGIRLQTNGKEYTAWLYIDNDRVSLHLSPFTYEEARRYFDGL